MSKRCELTGVTIQSGNNVSHSNRKTRRRFLPNIQTSRFVSEALGKTFRFRVAASTIRSVEHNGGFDNFLVSTPARRLTEEAAQIRRQIKKKAESKAA